MGTLLVSFAVDAAERLARHDVARENARVAATALARARVDRLEVEHFVQEHTRERAADGGAGDQRAPRAGHVR